MVCFPTPDSGLDLECGNLTFMCDTPSHYALSFGEVSLNLLEWYLSYYSDRILGAI